MGELEIPERALNLLSRSGRNMVESLELAAPIIVAAELRRLAATWDGYDPGFDQLLGELRERAAELDPEGTVGSWTRVTSSRNEFGDRVYRPSCDCGWFGASFYTQEGAERSLAMHARAAGIACEQQHQAVHEVVEGS